MLEDDRADNQRGIVSTNSINWDKFKEFDRKNIFLEYTNQSLETLKQVPKEGLFKLRKAYYKMMLEKETDFFLTTLHVTEMRQLPTKVEKGARITLQFDRIMKSSKPSSPTVPKLLNGTPYIKQKGYFEQLYIDLGTRNNYPKSNLPTLTIFYVMNLRQIQKDVEIDLLNCVDMKTLTQVNRIKNPSEKEIEEAKNKGPNSDFVYCAFPTYEGEKLRGTDEHICIISVLGDPSTVFFDNGFSIGDEKKPLLSGYERKKLPNRLSCTAPLFMKRPIKTVLTIVKDVVKYFATLLNYVTVPKKLTLIITSLLYLSSR